MAKLLFTFNPTQKNVRVFVVYTVRRKKIATKKESTELLCIYHDNRYGYNEHYVILGAANCWGCSHTFAGLLLLSLFLIKSESSLDWNFGLLLPVCLSLFCSELSPSCKWFCTQRFSVDEKKKDSGRRHLVVKRNNTTWLSGCRCT